MIIRWQNVVNQFMEMKFWICVCWGGIKIHRVDCPNAPELYSKFGYRIVKAQWSGQSGGTQYPITLHVIGKDDIGIVTNITSLIDKEKNIVLRSISIDSKAGLLLET